LHKLIAIFTGAFLMNLPIGQLWELVWWSLFCIASHALLLMALFLTLRLVFTIWPSFEKKDKIKRQERNNNQ
jgi:hypothetical protein